jgi:prevent-host-death family protein
VSISKKKSRAKAAKPPRARWQLQEAKARFSEVVRRAQSSGPQVITKQGRDEVVVVPVEEFRKLTARLKQPQSIVEFFAKSPLADVELDLSRPREAGRRVEL